MKRFLVIAAQVVLGVVMSLALGALLAWSF